MKRRLLCAAWLVLPLGALAQDYEYRVLPNDTLIGISERLLLAPAEWPKLQKLNGVRNPRHLQPGSTVRIPLEMLRSTPMQATVVQVQGKANVQSGAILGEGAAVRTDENSTVTVQFADGSRTRVQPASEMRVDALRTYPGTDVSRTSMQLLRGRIESLVERLRGGAKHEVTTPAGSSVVRGTHFRVASEGATGAQRTEVIEGSVEVAGRADPARTARATAGFGTVVDADGRVAEPTSLLAAPDVSGLPVLAERVVLRFNLPPLAGAQRYRAQVATDREFGNIVAQAVDPQVRFTGLADGAYFLRVRGIDARGLEGRDADHAFRLKARPEPPLLSQPAQGGKSAGASTAFAWAENSEAANYRFQLAREAGFRELVADNAAVAGSKFQVDGLAPGQYFWRVASVRAGGDQGPFGDVQRFTQRPVPAAPEPPEVGDDALRFRWNGEPGQTFDFQLARDPSFAALLDSRSLSAAQVEIPRPGPGKYFMRFRARDPDGFVGPYTAPQSFELPACVMDTRGRCVKTNFESHIGTR